MVKRKFQKRKVFLNEFHDGRLALQLYFPPSATLKDIDDYLELARKIDEKLNHPYEVTYKLTLIERKEYQL